jgi:hypothetical protein
MMWVASMRLLPGVLAFLLVVAAAPLVAQECLEMRRDEIHALVAKDAPGRLAGCTTSCKGCGCKGGPGYRDNRGRCVGWRELISRCGEAPHARCSRECFPVVSGCARPDVDGAKERAAAERERLAKEAEKTRAKGQ